MQNQENIMGYNMGHEDGYCQIPPKFLSNGDEDSFTRHYLSGYHRGQKLREAVEGRIEKFCNDRDP